MLKTLNPPESQEGYQPKPFPQTPAYAMMALQRVVEQDALEEASPWLAMLDRQSPQTAASFVAHELVRFLKTEVAPAQSSAAASLPPFAAIEALSLQEKKAMYRFYRVMEAFEMSAPPVTLALLEEVPAVRADAPAPDAAALERAAQAGNRAGYLLALAGFLQKHPPVSLPLPALLQRIEELRFLREEPLARQLAAVAVLAAMQ